MCLAPNVIPNPYYHFKGPLAYLHDTQSQYMYVPCGVCKQCVALKQMYTVQRVQMEARNSFMFFSTLTYNEEMLPRYILSNGVKIPFADVNHLQNMFKRLRKFNSFGRPFRYFAASERGSKGGRPHFHILWFLPMFPGENYIDGLGLQNCVYDAVFNNWCVNVGSTRSPEYVPLFTYRSFFRDGKIHSTFDTHFVTPWLTSDGVSSLAFYVSKYLMKGSNKERRLQQALRLNLSADEYDEVFSIIKSKSLRSQHFGLQMTDYSSSLDVVKYLRSCVDRSRGSNFPLFFSPDCSLTFPLSPYYKSKPFIYSFKDHLDFKLKDDNMFVDFDKSLDTCQNTFHAFERIQQLVDKKDFSIDLFNF